MHGAGSIVVLTGAGVSAESGLPTFRGAGGVWENHRVEDVASPEAFERDPELVLRFYNSRRRQLLNARIRPNPAHYALARLERWFPGRLTLVTQNVDHLHEQAGSREPLHMHGELLKQRCVFCGRVCATTEDITTVAACDGCGEAGGLRPHVVWFGEMPLHMDRIHSALEECDLFISVGTSGNVYPAAGFVEIANLAGAHSVEINLEPSATESYFRQKIYGPAGIKLPEFVDWLTGPQATDV